jgi:DNA polymerase-1
MEFNGIRVEPEKLSAMSERFDARIAELRSDIMRLAGQEFNPDSPKQLAVILFEKLGLPVIKRTTTGASTDVEVLQELSEHEIASKLHRCVAETDLSQNGSHPYFVPPRCGRHRAAQQQRSQSAKHPHPNRGRQAYSLGFLRRS